MIWQGFKAANPINIFEMFSAFEDHYESKYDFEGESHDFWECVYIINGEAIVSGGGSVYNLSSGNIVFHKPMEFHKLSVIKEGSADILIFSFNAAGELMPFFEGKVFMLDREQTSIVSGLIDYMRKKSKPTDAETIREHRYLAGFETDCIYAQTVVSYIHLLLLSLADNGIPAAVSNHPDARIFRRAAAFMEKHKHEPLSVPEIAKHCSISITSLKRVFSKYAGIPVHQYFLKIKIQYASELLQSGMSVCETAMKLGFCSQAYFSKAFKRETGLNPSTLKQF